MTRDERRKRMLAGDYEIYARIRTGDDQAQLKVMFCMDQKILEDRDLCEQMLSHGPIDAPQYMPAGGMADGCQLDFIRQW